MKQEMLINVAQPEECRIAIVEDGTLEELYVERAGQDNYVGNIYRGVVVNLEPSIQAAFVDFGVGRNGFLHISDVEPQYFRQGGFDLNKLSGPPDAPHHPTPHGDSVVGDEFDEGLEDDAKRPRNGRFGGRPRFKPPIQEIFRRGDEVLVQVIKEGIGSKGPTLSTYISIPGRYLVLMPALGRIGVSRKIEDEATRRRLRDIMIELNPPKGVGFIVRTAGSDRTKRELSRDMAYLLRLWKVIVRRIKKLPAPVGIYEESDMITRTIRDIFTAEVDAIYIDEPTAYERAKEFLQLVMPRYVNRLQLYEGKEPLFCKYNLDEEIAKIHRRRVPLRSGGSIVIDQTEALVAIDVNSGSFRTEDSAEDTAHQMNMLAAREIARQIRLRDLGGVIVNDFIDMRKEKHRRGVERALRDAVKRDRARTKILRTSPFGLIEMTRQRIRTNPKRSAFSECPACSGSGVVKTPESMAIDVVRLLILASQRPSVARIRVSVAEAVADYLNNKKRHELARLEEEGEISIQIVGKEEVSPEYLVIECRAADDREIKFP
jgi:ribonuclease E